MNISAKEEQLRTRLLRDESGAYHETLEWFAPPLLGFLFALTCGDWEIARLLFKKSITKILKEKKFLEKEESIFLHFFAEAIHEYLLVVPDLPISAVDESLLETKLNEAGYEIHVTQRLIAILKALSNLHPQDRQVLLMRDQLGLSLNEIEYILRLTPPAIKRCLLNARLILRENIGKSFK